MNNFVRGFIDGSLSTLGVLIGASAGDTSIILSAGLGGTLANGVSNMLGAFSAEKAKQYGELRQVEKAMVATNLKDSILDQRIGPEIKKAGVIDGIATIIGGIIPIIPFFLMHPAQATLVAIGTVLLLLVILGVYLGKISKENIILSAIKMVVLGIVIALLSFGVQYIFTPV